jgi:hypothetical protein
MANESLEILVDIRNWIRAASYAAVKSSIEAALPDLQSRRAYQALDGTCTIEQARVTAKMSPNKLIALSPKWTSMGLMELTPEKKRRRLFDLADFGLITFEE